MHDAEHLRQQHERWRDNRPASFDPYFVGDEVEIGTTFPDIRFSSPWHGREPPGVNDRGRTGKKREQEDSEADTAKPSETSITSSRESCSRSTILVCRWSGRCVDVSRKKPM